ncbi:ESPR domain-containing protein [Aggregatibacter kilianii]
MNKTFKVIWNSSKQTCSVASELSRSHAKSSSTTATQPFLKSLNLVQ